MCRCECGHCTTGSIYITHISLCNYPGSVTPRAGISGFISTTYYIMLAGTLGTLVPATLLPATLVPATLVAQDNKWGIKIDLLISPSTIRQHGLHWAPISLSYRPW